MVDIHADPAAAAASSDRGRLMALVVYGLYIAAFINGITAIIGVVLAYVGRDEARGTVYESHYSNAITTFWVTLGVFALLSIVTVISVVGFLGGTVDVAASHAGNHVRLNPTALVVLPVICFGYLGLVVWYLYRTITGLVRALDAKPYA